MKEPKLEGASELCFITQSEALWVIKGGRQFEADWNASVGGRTDLRCPFGHFLLLCLFRHFVKRSVETRSISFLRVAAPDLRVNLVGTFGFLIVSTLFRILVL